MYSSAVLLLCACFKSRKLGAAKRRELRRRLYVETCIDEWRRMVRVRHYITLDS
ncbi:hypothetical protein PR001_g4156 [Phytophthora rubi]|uniref:Uncharacterized protein n=1 Tax=Phytophthora rubi TaxID=129364 RepID=A0A6A3P1R8_9STRA|nr:hypothetical protein PR002_g4289 [Phytophthora rubi]KAE9047594.1 hypothetical protein PR001_g4156 [Phytophthora rubi]